MMSRRARWLLGQRIRGFLAVATMVAAVTCSALWWVVQADGVAEVSVQEIAESDVVPLGTVLLFRIACAAVALTTLGVYRDPEGLELRYREATVHLRRYRRWTTFTVWCFTLLCGYFTLAAYCSSAVHVGYGALVPSTVVQATLVLFEVSYPMSLLVTAVVTFVLIPVACQTSYPLGRLFRWRALLMHNGNVLMMQLAMLLAPPPITLAHLPYAVLFGCGYALFAWGWFWHTRVFYYFFLDYRRPYAVWAYLGLFTTLAGCYGLGWLIADVTRHTGSRWWIALCLLLVPLGITRFRVPRPLNSGRNPCSSVAPSIPSVHELASISQLRIVLPTCHFGMSAHLFERCMNGPFLVARREVPSIYRHLSLTLRIIAIPFRRRHSILSRTLKTLPCKKPLGSFLGCTGKNIRQSLPFPLLYHRVN